MTLPPTIYLCNTHPNTPHFSTIHTFTSSINTVPIIISCFRNDFLTFFLLFLVPIVSTKAVIRELSAQILLCLQKHVGYLQYSVCIREEEKLASSSIDFFFVKGLLFLSGRVKYSIIHPSFVTNGVYLDIIKKYSYLFFYNEPTQKKIVATEQFDTYY